MRFPSLDYVWAEARGSLSRFPLIIAAGILSAVSGIVAIEEQGPDELVVRLLIGCALGIGGFAAIELTAERRGLGRAGMLSWHALLAAFLGSLVWASGQWSDPTMGRRTIQFALGFHLLVAFLPFAGLGEENGFWQYNRHLFLRFLRSVLFSAVLYLGLALALLAVDNLLGVPVDEENYLRLFLILAFVFNTWYFAAGIPGDLGALERARDYPVGLRVFSQYILVPLVIVYLVILLLYLGRVLITQEWPSGWIGYLVTSVSVVGILALLLVYPLRGRPESRWVDTFSRVFYIALLPPLVMLFLAVWKRIDQYGITENRYFLVVLALWLTGISLYFIFSRGRNVKVIPTTLAIVAFLTTAGPWGAYTVSRQSQFGRLRDLLDEKAFLVDGRVPTVPGDRSETLSAADRRELSSIMDYLIDNHSLDALQPLFETGLAGLASADSNEGAPPRRSGVRAPRVLESMGVEYVGPRELVQGRDFVYMSHDMNEAVSITGFDRMLVFHAAQASVAKAGEYEFATKEGGILEVLREGQVLVSVDLTETVHALEGQTHQVPSGQLSVAAERSGVRARFDFDRISGERHDDGSIDLRAASGRMFVALSSATPALPSDGGPTPSTGSEPPSQP